MTRVRKSKADARRATVSAKELAQQRWNALEIARGCVRWPEVFGELPAFFVRALDVWRASVDKHDFHREDVVYGLVEHLRRQGYRCTIGGEQSAYAKAARMLGLSAVTVRDKHGRFSRRQKTS